MYNRGFQYRQLLSIHYTPYRGSWTLTIYCCIFMCNILKYRICNIPSCYTCTYRLYFNVCLSLVRLCAGDANIITLSFVNYFAYSELSVWTQVDSQLIVAKSFTLNINHLWLWTHVLYNFTENANICDFLLLLTLASYIV